MDMLNIEKEKPYSRLLKILFSVLALGLLISFFYKNIETDKNIDNTPISYIHPAYFFESDTFTDAVGRVKESNKKYPKPILGGVVPHHLLPSFIIADFFKNLAEQNPDTIILIGPNHYELGNRPVLSSLGGWDTPFGVVEPNKEIIDEFYTKNHVDFNDKVLDEEHSMGGIMPFIKHYLPNAKVVPIILSGNLKMNEIENLANTLASKVNKKTVIVASVDFSHYQVEAQAKINDEVTLQLMEDNDYSKMIDLSSAYIDSPTSIITLLMVMKKVGKKDFDLVYHTNAGEILRDPYHEVTSYFSFVF